MNEDLIRTDILGKICRELIKESNSLFTVLCTGEGNILEADDSFKENFFVNPEIDNLGEIILPESRETLENLIKSSGQGKLHMRTINRIVESLLCSSEVSQSGVNLLLLRERSGSGKVIEDLSRQRNLMHKSFLEKDNENLNLIQTLYKNSRSLYRYFSYRKNPDFEYETLTGREKKLFSLIRKDVSRDELATKMSISSSTLDKHIRSLMKKVNARTYQDLIKLKESLSTARKNIPTRNEAEKMAQRNYWILESFAMNRSIDRSSESYLTQREQEILSLIKEGKANREIAEILYISENTVKSHITRIFKKFEITSRNEL